MKMGSMKSFGRCSIVMGMVLMLMKMKVGIAVDYTVGGENGGWDQSTNLASWASQLSFHTGDSLIFQYTPNHSVLEVSEEDFNSCTTTNPLRPPFSGSRIVVPLTAAGSRYFICGTDGHCQSGMKLQVNTIADAVASPTPTTQSPPPKPSSPASSPPPKSTKAAPWSKQNKATASSPALSPATAPSPSGSLSPPPSPSSAPKFNAVGALAAAAAWFLMMVV